VNGKALILATIARQSRHTEPVHPFQRLLNRGLRKLQGGTLRITYWNGQTRRFGRGEPVVHLHLKTPAIVPRLLLDPELAFGEAFQRGDLTIDGRLDDLVRLVNANEAPMPRAVEALFHGAALFSRWQGISVGRNRRDVQAHYDLGNDFYQLWLDPSMTYSCALFRTLNDSLEQAQNNKLRHLLLKLRLEDGQTLLDVGCGWGALLAQATRQYDVQALGITLSEEQKHWFDEKTKPSLENRAEVRLQHYHELAQSGQKFDRLVTVGMAEHVGRHNLPAYIEDLKTLLKPGGLGVLHCITNVKEEPTSAWIVKYIFPGGYIPSLSEVVHEMSARDLVVYDVENLGQHYALTLDKWSEGFERNVEWVRQRYGEEFVRMWRLYLGFSAASFREEDIYVHQILFCNGKARDYPLSRQWMYETQLE